MRTFIVASALGLLAAFGGGAAFAEDDLDCGIYAPDQEEAAAATPEAWTRIAEREIDGRRIFAVQCVGFDSITADQINALQLWEGEGANRRAVEIVARLVTGVDRPDYRPGPGESRDDEPNGFVLYAPIRPNVQSSLFSRRAATYTVTGAPLPEAGQKFDADTWDPDAKRLGTVGVWASVLDGDDDGLGVKIDGQWVIAPSARMFNRNFVVAASAHGEFASDEEDLSSFSRSFKADLNASYFFLIPGTASGAQVDFTPIAVESDQDGDAIVGRSTIGVTARVPGTQQLASFLGFGCERVDDEPNCISAGMFVSLDAGASYDLRSPDDAELSDGGTWGAELWYSFPLSTNWDLSIEASARDDGGDDGVRESHEISLRYFLNCPRRAAFTISYIDGEFSPLGEQIDGLRMGLTTLLGAAGAPRNGNLQRCENR